MSEPTEVLDPPRHRRVRVVDAPRRRRVWPWVATLLPVALLATLIVGWAVDSSGGRVQRGVEIAGVNVGGSSEDALPAKVTEVAAALASRPVELVTPDTTYRTTAGELGLSVDERATTAAALEVGEDTFWLVRPFEWAVAWFRTHEVEPLLRVDASQLATTLTNLEGDDRVAPIEPSVELTDAGFEVRPGQDGRGLDAAAVAEQLPSIAAATSPDEAIVVRVEPVVIRPRGTDEAAEEAAAEAAMLTAEPLAVATPAGPATIPVEEQRSWVLLTSVDDGHVQVSFDRQLVSESLEQHFSEIEGAPRDARFDVQGGQVVIIPSEAGQVCCADTSPDRVVEALREGRRSVQVDLVRVEPEFTTADAEALGIVEEIGSPDAWGPTTEYPCCQSRVQNIHRISDIVRGYVILPGETFSVNDFVGRRTRENGFVEAGVIYQGVYQTDVGGGVSQFATTLFNAALFAGLDMPEYQSHSLYISRYPRHEATISYPAPDLKIENTTPHGVLVWPEYTDSSITVRLYSTRHAQVLIGEPSPSPAGRCTRWTTPRVRVYPDGEEVHDSVSSTYRPAEGVNC